LRGATRSPSSPRVTESPSPPRAPTRLLFVCLGNYCRSPMAEALARHRARERGAAGAIEIGSAGTRPFRVGGAPHPSVPVVLGARGIDASGLAGRAVTPDDAGAWDRILAVDRHVLQQLESLPFGKARIDLLLPYGASGRLDVPDPFVGGGFEEVFDLLDDACCGLLDDVLAERARRSG
jgi:protein-tyrosine phosphatase